MTGGDTNRKVSKRTRQLRKWLDESMSRRELDYIMKVDKEIEKKLTKLHKQNLKLLDEIISTFTSFGYESKWKNPTEAAGNNHHRARVGRTGPENGMKGHVVNKIDVNQGTRIFIIRYYDDVTDLHYVMLLGVLLASEREKHNEWKHEMRRIQQRFGGVVYDSVDEETDDSIYIGGKFIDSHSGFLDNFSPDEVQGMIDDGLAQIDTNITMTYDQIGIVEKVLPLIIDGHAGTGKSVIIALRIALESITAHQNNAVKHFLVVAYNQRVLNMVERYAKKWMRTLCPDIPDDVISRVKYQTTLNVYRDLTKKVHYESIPDTSSIASISKLVSFFRFDHQFFSAPHRPRTTVSPEQAWHFIRGILKGSGFGWIGDSITKDDFASLNSKGRIPKKSTELMSSELIGELLQVFNEYETWRKEANAIDDIDLVRLATIALENYGNNEPSEASYKGSEYFRNFDIVFVDEAQDLTIAEFELLHQLLTDQENARIVIGGDPLQTINPTGFTWEAISVFLYDKLNKVFDFERMLVSHRLTKSLVDFANVIVEKRHQFEKGELQLMRASDEFENDSSHILRIPINMTDQGHTRKIESFLKDSLGSNYGILIWARDKGERDDMIKKDPVLSKLVELSTKDGEDINDRVLLHSVESVKGLEYENVIFYRFGDLGQQFNELMKKAMESETDTTDRYTLLYHLNRLFIAATRSKSNIYIFDSQENLDNSWGESWWGNNASVVSDLDAFLDNITVEPSLQIAKMYLRNAKETNDLRRAADAILTARKCPDSVERNTILREAEILKIRLELELNTYSELDKRRKQERLIELFSEGGQVEHVVEVMLQLEQWDDVRIEIEKGNLPESPKFKFYKSISSLHLKQDGVESLEEILMYQRTLFQSQPPALKNTLESRIREHIKKYVTELNSSSLKSMVSVWNYTRLDVIKWLKPQWKKEDPVSCLKQRKDFENKIKASMGDPSSLKDNERVAFYHILISDPHISRELENSYLDRLAELGDYNAGKRRLKDKFISANSWDFTTIKSDVYFSFLNALESGVYRDDVANTPFYDAIIPRLKFFRDYHKLNSRTPTGWLNVLDSINSRLLAIDLTENEPRIRSDLPPFDSLGNEGGRIWTEFETNFLKISESVRTHLKSELLNRIFFNKPLLQQFNLKSANLQRLLRIEGKRSLELWVEGLRLLKDSIANPNSEYDSECIYLYSASIDSEKSRKLPSHLQKQFAYNLGDILLEIDDYDGLRRNPESIPVWVIEILGKANEYKDVITRVGLYKQYKNWMANPDSFNDGEIENMMTLANSLDSDLYVSLSEITGKKVGQIDISVFLKNIKPGPYNRSEVEHALKENIIEFNLNELPWMKPGMESKKAESYLDEVEDLKPFERLIYGAIFGVNFNCSMLTVEWAEPTTFDDQRMLGLAKILSKRADRVTELWSHKEQYWEDAARRDGLLDTYKPRAGNVFHVAFSVYAVFELLYVLWNMNNNNERVKYLRNSWVPNLKANATKSQTIDALFEHPIVQLAFSEHEENMELAKEMLAK